jgi:hypothetical protein
MNHEMIPGTAPKNAQIMAVDVVVGGCNNLLEEYRNGVLIEHREWFEPTQMEECDASIGVTLIEWAYFAGRTGTGG